ncbi:hypothetical protein [uncultured Kordia sp.]|uniref:hypothetical protein n=1 Tax=uncultured Kordia sp. TaxID=507699 RepID=UPI0026068984|nr:hypothetical protein [uncultured Kordia sp.]
MIQFKLLPKWFSIFFISFILCTIIGTQTHELGHIAVAKYLGYETQLSYGSMSYHQKGFSEDQDVQKWRSMFEKIGSYDNFTEQEKQEVNALYDKIQEKFPNNPLKSFYVTLGGPSQTILTCFIGLFLLAYRNRRKEENFKIIDWVSVFLSLFILREVFNTVMAGVRYLINGTKRFRGDEFYISEYLGLNYWTVPVMTAILGAIIASFIIFMIIPIKYRFTFIVAGCVGSVSGFILWFNFLGPWLFHS